MPRAARRLVLVVAVSSAASAALVFVPALPFDSASGFREDQSAACTRNGLLPTPYLVPVSSTGAGTAWTAAAVSQAVASLLLPANWSATPAAPGAQCCVNSLWCTASPNSSSSLVCGSHGFGSATFVNYGWTTDTAQAPVYTCAAPGVQNATAFALSVPAVRAARVVVDSYYSTTRLQVDGVGFGSSVAALGVLVGGVSCVDLDVCHNQCKPCQSNADCGDDKQCTSINAGAPSYCLRPCNYDNSCPCGARCYLFVSDASGRNPRRLCANIELSSRGPFCPAGGGWAPPNSTAGDSRIECALPSNSKNFASGYPVGPGATSVVATSRLRSRRLGAADSSGVSLSSSRGGDTSMPGEVALVRPVEFDPLATPDAHEDEAASSADAPVRGLAPTRTTSATTLAGYSALTGWRYGNICAGLGASAAGQPGVFAVSVSRGGVSSTGIGVDFAASAGLNASIQSAPPFGGLPYTGVILGFNVTARTCVDDSSCPPIDRCSVPRCDGAPANATALSVGGCCVYVPSGNCTSALPVPANGRKPFSAAYAVLPRELAAVLPLPPPPCGGGGSKCPGGDAADMRVGNASGNPNAVVWSPRSPWYAPANLTQQGGYEMSSVSTEHVYPQQAAAIGFKFPFYDARCVSRESVRVWGAA